MDSAVRLAIEAECRNLLIAFGRNLDDGNAEAAGGLFAPDGVWERQGTLVKGPDAVSAVIKQRPHGVILRHLFTNMAITVSDESLAVGRAYYVVFRDDGESGVDTLPRRVEGPERVGDYFTTFVRTPSGWRIAYNAAKRIFKCR